MTGICFVSEPICLQPDDAIKYAYFRIAIIILSEAPLDFEVKDFGELAFVPDQIFP